MDREARKIVETALTIRASHPQVSALDVVDLAMEGQHDSNPDFDGADTPRGDYTDPDHPFGRLLRDAFAPEITDAELTLALASDLPRELWVRWMNTVITPFGRRYGLWS